LIFTTPNILRRTKSLQRELLTSLQLLKNEKDPEKNIKVEELLKEIEKFQFQVGDPPSPLVGKDLENFRRKISILNEK